MVRTRLAALALALLAVGVFAAPAQAGHRPIVFVHGFCPICSQTLTNASWEVMVGRFENDGWPAQKLKRFEYDTSESNAVSAVYLKAFIDKVRANLGVEEVDVVAHSMGSLVTRWCVKFATCHVQDAALIAGPNHGTTLAFACSAFLVSCRQMEQGSDFLRTLNSGDETPPQARWGTWRSPCDEVIFPHSSPALQGAANHETECLGHVGMIFDGSVYRSVRDFING